MTSLFADDHSGCVTVADHAAAHCAVFKSAGRSCEELALQRIDYRLQQS